MGYKNNQALKAETLPDKSVDPKNQPAYVFTILVIDDEPETAKLLESLLKPLHCQVLSAANGAQGLRLAAAELPDLVVLDLSMPGIPGQEVCRRLKETEKTFPIPIVIFTGDKRIRNEASCFDLGTDDYLIKGSNNARLVARIRSVLRRRRFNADPKGVIRIGKVSLDMVKHLIHIRGTLNASLTPKESSLCSLLMSACGKPVEPRVLFKKLYGSWPLASDKRIKKHISNLRLKLGSYKKLIEAIRSEGYSFNMEYAKELAGLQHSTD